jgi:hypothetical protein
MDKTLLPQAGSLAKLLKELSSNKNNQKSPSPAQQLQQNQAVVSGLLP